MQAISFKFLKVLDSNSPKYFKESPLRVRLTTAYVKGLTTVRCYPMTFPDVLLVSRF